MSELTITNILALINLILIIIRLHWIEKEIKKLKEKAGDTNERPI